MTTPGYPEAQLVTNRTSVLVFGATEAERLAWAEEAASAFEHEGPLFEAREPEHAAQALGRKKGVIYFPDVSALSWDTQRELARVLHEKEERPKFVFGLSFAPANALAKGTFRDDLKHALDRSTVDLGQPEVKAQVKARRAKAKTGAGRK